MQGLSVEYQSNTARGIMENVYSKSLGADGKSSITNEEFSFAAILAKEEKENAPLSVTDSIGIVKKQMGKNDKASFAHNGVGVCVETNSLLGDSITIGGSDNPEWITIQTSVGAVKIDMNDLASVGRCMDLFSPEDQNKILEGITKYKMAKHAEAEMDENEAEIVKALTSQNDKPSDIENDNNKW